MGRSENVKEKVEFGVQLECNEPRSFKTHGDNEIQSNNEPLSRKFTECSRGPNTSRKSLKHSQIYRWQFDNQAQELQTEKKEERAALLQLTFFFVRKAKERGDVWTEKTKTKGRTFTM